MTRWNVGFYAPDGAWHGDSEHPTPEAAAARVAYLNGGGNADTLLTISRQLQGLIDAVVEE